MRKSAEKYFEELKTLMNAINATGKDSEKIEVFCGIEKAAEIILSTADSNGKVIFIGNGASAAFSSHMATDFWKNGGIKATAFNDSSLLTCIGNDYGFECLFEKPLEVFADNRDLLIAISSSGKSENIIRGAKVAISKGCNLITLSGFNSENPLSKMGKINFYVGSSSYGPVEILHQAILHCLLDVIIAHKNG